MADHAPSTPFPASSRTHGACSWRRGPEPADPLEPVRQARQRPRSGGRAQRRRLRSVPDERQEHALPARRGGRDPARGGQARPGDRDSPDRPVRPRAGKVAMGTSETNHSRSQSRTDHTGRWRPDVPAAVRPVKPAIRGRRKNKSASNWKLAGQTYHLARVSKGPLQASSDPKDTEGASVRWILCPSSMLQRSPPAAIRRGPPLVHLAWQ